MNGRERKMRRLLLIYKNITKPNKPIKPNVLVCGINIIPSRCHPRLDRGSRVFMKGWIPDQVGDDTECVLSTMS